MIPFRYSAKVSSSVTFCTSSSATTHTVGIVAVIVVSVSFAYITLRHPIVDRGTLALPSNDALPLVLGSVSGGPTVTGRSAIAPVL